MINSEDISVIMPYYNVPIDYARQAIESVIGEKRPKANLVLVNDGSSPQFTGPLEEIVTELEKYEKPITYIKLNKNRGLPVAINKGVCESSKYFIWVDPDDIVNIHSAVSRLYREFKNGCNAVISDQLYVDNSMKRVIANRKKGPLLELWNKYKNTIYDPILHFSFFGALRAFEKGFFESIGGMDEKIKFAEDHDLWVRATELTNFHISNIPESLYIHRNNPNSIRNSHFKEIIEITESFLHKALERREIEGTAKYLGKVKLPQGYYHSFFDIKTEKGIVSPPYLDRQRMSFKPSYF